MSRDCCVALPRGAMGLSAVCDCGISRSYSVTILKTALDLHILSLRINYESFLIKDYLLPMVQTANLTNGTKVQLQKVN